jgi:hypothetical protein
VIPKSGNRFPDKITRQRNSPIATLPRLLAGPEHAYVVENIDMSIRIRWVFHRAAIC